MDVSGCVDVSGSVDVSGCVDVNWHVNVCVCGCEWVCVIVTDRPVFRKLITLHCLHIHTCTYM